MCYKRQKGTIKEHCNGTVTDARGGRGKASGKRKDRQEPTTERQVARREGGQPLRLRQKALQEYLREQPPSDKPLVPGEASASEQTRQDYLAGRDKGKALESYEPRTPLGRRLWEIRAKIVASGEPLLGWEEIEREVAERRGEAE